MKPNTNSLFQPPDQKIPRASMHLSAWMTVFLVTACGLGQHLLRATIGRLDWRVFGVAARRHGTDSDDDPDRLRRGSVVDRSARGLVREPPPDLVCARTMVIKKGRVYETSYKQ